MYRSFLIIFLILTLSLIITDCNKQEKIINREAEIQEISRVIDSCIGWFKTKDFELSKCQST